MLKSVRNGFFVSVHVFYNIFIGTTIYVDNSPIVFKC